MDLKLRGPGDFFSSINGDNIRQSGGFEFKYASMCDDNELSAAAFAEAKYVTEKDPRLELSENSALRKEVLARMTPRSSTIS